MGSSPYSSSGLGNLTRHAERRHSPSEGRPQSRTWTCYFCSKTINSIQSLTNHLRLRTLETPWVCGKEKPFSCKECSKCFISQAQLKRHIGAVHRREKHFFCEFCNYSSYEKSNCDRHRLQCKAKLPSKKQGEERKRYCY